MTRPRGSSLSVSALRSCGAWAALALGGCGEAIDREGALELLARVQQADYRNWARPAGYEARRPSVAAHATDIDLFVNAEVERVLQEDAPVDAWAEGSAIVKDSFRDEQLSRIAVMEKRSGGWYWAEYDAHGEPLYAGQPSVCTDCHASGTDFTRAFSLPDGI